MDADIEEIDERPDEEDQRYRQRRRKQGPSPRALHAITPPAPSGKLRLRSSWRLRPGGTRAHQGRVSRAATSAPEHVRALHWVGVWLLSRCVPNRQIR